MTTDDLAVVMFAVMITGVFIFMFFYVSWRVGGFP